MSKLVGIFRGGCDVLALRHCESEANAGLASASFADIRLTERGGQHAERVAGAVQAIQVGRVYASPFRRALDTAAPIGRVVGKPVRPLPEATEFDYLPRWTGPTTDEDRRPARERYWAMMDPLACPGAESFSDLVFRVTGLIKRLSRLRQWDAVVLVSHEQVIVLARILCQRDLVSSARTLTPDALQVLMRDFRAALTTDRIANGTGVWLHLAPGRFEVGERWPSGHR